MDGMVGVYKTQITESLSIDSTTFSLLFAIPAATGICCGFLSPLIQRFGTPRMSLFSGVIMMIASVGVALGL